MKFIKNGIALLFMITAWVCQAQQVATPKFSATYSKNNPKAGEIIEVIITTTVPDGWHLYSSNTNCPEDDGPIRAEITLASNPSFELVGSLKSVGDHMAYEEVFNCSTGEFKGKAKFVQKIKVLKDINGIDLDFYGQMCTNDATGRCVSVKDKFKAAALSVIGETTPSIKPEDSKLPEIKNNEGATPNESIEIIDKIATPDSNMRTVSIAETSSSGGLGHYAKKNANDNEPCINKSAGAGANQNNWQIFIAALLSGFLGLLTPCVFPMIPMTVSFFMKNKSKAQTIKEAIVFAISIVLIYVLLGTVIAVAFGANAGNWLSTHWLPNILFFIIFVVFAASFFGAFEIVLPSSLVNKADQQVDKGGFLGPVFMAITIALVSFSCTGPIVGTVLVKSASTGEVLSPIIAMLGFGLAFALPFSLFAIFPSYLSKLPKRGGWLNSVKVVLGFIELAFALKFLSVADQTYHWGLLDREVYLSLWIVIFALMGFYLLGKIKFSHDSDMPYLKVPRLMFAIATLAFTVYMIPGLWGAPLKFLAGFLPPMSTQDFVLGNTQHAGGAGCGNIASPPSYSDRLHIPQGICGYFDYEEAVAAGKELNLPVFLDFTGHGCVNCRKMEEKVWSDPRVSSSLKRDFVVASLYVDDKVIQLPASQHFIGRSSGYEIKTLGDKNAEIEACYFNSNSQPLYVLLDPFTEKILTKANESAESNGYDADKFVAFLNEGLSNYKALNH